MNLEQSKFRFFSLRRVFPFAFALAGIICFSNSVYAWELEVVVDGNMTFLRCSSEVDVQSQIQDCSDQETVWDCSGEVIAIERDEFGNCSVRYATAEETQAFLEREGQVVDTLLAAGEVPGGGPQGPPVGAIGDNLFGSTTTSAAQEQDISPTTPSLQ